ncbi:hypothetical protein F2Q69_00007310 [Brassica cretica]|uniref:Uncharacterized protein n=1 Tax=Brassica cretica TaxID=69181 RepID=A0A8S9P632_BRACR|nr:hypothetical protein F2Q69_00007310 [Brassica cretica]
MGEDDHHQGDLACGRGRPSPRSPRPWARTTSTTVASPMGEEDPRPLPKIDVACLNALRNPAQPSKTIADNFGQHSDDAQESMQVDQTSDRRTLRQSKEKVPRNLKREVNEKEMDSFTKSVLGIPLDKPFEEAYFTHMLGIKSIDNSPTNETFALPEHFYPSFAVNTQPQTSIDYHYGDMISRQVDYSIGSWADDSHHEGFAVDTEFPECDLMNEKETLIDSRIKPSIDAHHVPDSEVQVQDNIEYGYLTPDEFGIFRDPEGQARAMDGRVLHISKEDIADIIGMNGSRNFLDTQNRVENPPSIDKAALPSIDDQSEFKRIALHQNRKMKPRLEMRNMVQYQPCLKKTLTAKPSISWLTTCMDEMKHDIAMIQEQHGIGAGALISIDENIQPSNDARTQTSIDARLASFEDRLQAFIYRIDGVYYPLRNDIDSLNTHMNALQQEMETIQRHD